MTPASEKTDPIYGSKNEFHFNHKQIIIEVNWELQNFSSFCIQTFFTILIEKGLLNSIRFLVAYIQYEVRFTRSQRWSTSKVWKVQFFQQQKNEGSDSNYFS